MSNITTSYTSGSVIYYIIQTSDDRVWNGSSFEVINVAHWASYANPMTEEVSLSGIYEAEFPSGIRRGIYTLIAYKQSGAQPATGDSSVLMGGMDWNGVSENSGGGATNDSSFSVTVKNSNTIDISTGTKDSGNNSGIVINSGVN